MKQEEAEAGRWIQSQDGSVRRYICGRRHDGTLISEAEDGETYEGDYCWEYWNLLPSECDSFDWQPETFPQWWTSLDSLNGPSAFVVRRCKDTYCVVGKDGKTRWTGLLWTENDQKKRKQITEAEVLALLNKPEPVESPDDWVTQDRVPARNEIDWGFFSPVIENSKPHGAWLFKEDVIAAGRRHGEKMKWGDLLNVWCRRKDLPPLPEPAKPATRKVVLKEYAVWDDDTADMQLLWKSCWPVDWEHASETGNTREIEVPL